MRIISLFSGCGGLDKGFENAGLEIVWANEFDKKIWDTFSYNFPNTTLDKRDITTIPLSDIPSNITGVIGGPPCQSWSEAGSLRGIADKRGKLFFEFVRIIENKQPLFFLAENVSGMLASRHSEAFTKILNLLSSAGYTVSWELINAKHYGIPQDRKRIIFVGYRKDLGKKFIFPKVSETSTSLKDVIWNLRNSAKPALEGSRANNGRLKIQNHEYLTGGFSTIYMSRNRVRSWHEPSFTIQAGGRHAPLHPQANKMIKVGVDKMAFDEQSLKPYRRLSVRECARIQTFPDDFLFLYKNVVEGYKMVGNAVPVRLAEILARQIAQGLSCKIKTLEEADNNSFVVGKATSVVRIN